MRCWHPSFSSLLALLPFLFVGLFSPALLAADIRIGVLAWMGEEAAMTEWQPLGTALHQALPQHHLSLRYLDLAALTEAVAKREVDFVVTNPGHYVALEASHGVTRIATQVIEPGQDAANVVGSAVIARADRADLRQLADLRQHRLAAVAEEAFGGYQVIWAELKRRGIDPEEGDMNPVFTGYPMSRVIEAVRDGHADAGVIRSCLLEQLIREGSVAASQFKVLSPYPHQPCLTSSPAYPGWAFAAAASTPGPLAREVLLALLALPPAQTGQFWGVPADYQSVHAMLRELQIAPYEFLREHRLEHQIRRYWPWAAAFLTVLLLWLAYTLRVEVLVGRRTRELSAALRARDQLAERIQSHQEQMEHLSRLSILGELSGTLAHELNQPLATIGNYANSLLRRLRRGNLSPDATAQAAEEIAQESERAAAVLAGIRDLARKRLSVRESRPAAELVTEAATLFHGLIPDAPAIDLQPPLPAAEIGKVLADPLQIQQVLLNLFKNALDAQRSAGRPDAAIEVCLQRGERVDFSIRDHGTGLDAAGHARLFEPFFTTKEDGMGLGLSICKTIIEAHGGQLTARQPDDGHGLCLCFSLPLAPEETP